MTVTQPIAARGDLTPAGRDALAVIAAHDPQPVAVTRRRTFTRVGVDPATVDAVNQAAAARLINLGLARHPHAGARTVTLTLAGAMLIAELTGADLPRPA